MKVVVPARPISIVLFLLLAFLCYEAHQLARLLVSAALCGGFGTMTFTVTTPREPCVLPTIVTLSGPVLTYGLVYLGMFLLRSQKAALFAYALIFASFSHLRFIQNLTGRGDELIFAQQWFGITSRPAVAAVVLLIGLPPVMVAFRAIANKRRLLVFIVSWLLPLPLLFMLLFGNEFLFGADGIGTHVTSVFGISLIVFITDLVAAALLVIFGRSYLRLQEEA